jgi:hypothetical protein
MTIKFDPYNKQEFIAQRLFHKNKVVNTKYLDLLTLRIRSSVEKYRDLTGYISYKNGDRPASIEFPYLFYNYGSPAPYMCKLLPNGYGFTNFYPNDIYKGCHIEFGIQQKLYNLYKIGKLTRYKQPENYIAPSLPDNYILVVMQNTRDTVWYRNKDFTELSKSILYWAKENKRNVVFKWHFGCVDHHSPQKWWESLENKSNYSFFDFTTPLNLLIENCSMLWTASSMSGIEALVCNKPVSIFGETEYMEMATVCETPDDAIKATVPKDLERWLTYYFRKYCINILDKNSQQLIDNRILNTFKYGMHLDGIILS